jgi:hypothetical protein
MLERVLRMHTLLRIAYSKPYEAGAANEADPLMSWKIIATAFACLLRGRPEMISSLLKYLIISRGGEMSVCSGGFHVSGVHRL